MNTLNKSATMGDKVHALRTERQMSMAELARRTGLSARAIRYYEDNERVPGVDAVKKLSAALEVSTGFFLDDFEYDRQKKQYDFLEQIGEEYGSRGKAQAKKLLADTSALFAGGELSEEEQTDFMDEMQELFVIAKKRAKEKRKTENNAKDKR